MHTNSHLHQSTANDSVAFNHILGQGRVNQLGGVFINGRPLPPYIRRKIVEMANMGIKPCQISRQLKVSHGAVSKILNRFQETGSIDPGQIGGNLRQKVTVQSIEKPLMMLFEENPTIHSSELRQKIIELGLCSRADAPTGAAINRFIRGKSWSKERRQEKKRLSHSIESILGISMDDSKSSSSDDDGSSPDSRRNRTSFTSEQLEQLENSFKLNTYPDAGQREQLARNTGLTEEKIMTWFSNRRARCRKHLPVFHPMMNPVMSAQSHQAYTLSPVLPFYMPTMSPMMFPTFYNSKT